MEISNLNGNLTICSANIQNPHALASRGWVLEILAKVYAWARQFKTSYIEATRAYVDDVIVRKHLILVDEDGHKYELFVKDEKLDIKPADDYEMQLPSDEENGSHSNCLCQIGDLKFEDGLFKN